MGVRGRLSWGALALLMMVAGICPRPVRAAEPVAPPDTDLAGALRSLASRAGLVFVGRVVAVQHMGGVVQVQFAVEQTIQGAAGATYTLREWAGLWPPGQYRYVAGQHVVIFLNPAGSAGLSTPVDGMEGVLPVVVQGASSPELVDVRRLASRVQRAVGSPLDGAGAGDSTETGAVLLSDVTAAVNSWRRPQRARLPRSPLPAPLRPKPILMQPADFGTATDPAEPTALPPEVLAPFAPGTSGTGKLLQPAHILPAAKVLPW